MVLNRFAELISIGKMMPFAKQFLFDINLININQLRFTFTKVFILLTLFAAFIRSCNYWLNGRFAAYIGSDLSCEYYGTN